MEFANPIYLDRHQPEINHRTMFVAWVDGSDVVYHQGRIGGRTREARRPFGSVQEAVTGLELMVRTHRLAGYQPCMAPSPWDRIMCSSKPDASLNPEETGLPYSMYWRSLRALSHGEVLEAAEICRQVLKDAEGLHPLDISIEDSDAAYGPRVVFSDASQKRYFGFVPKRQYDALQESSRLGLEQASAGYKSWLTPNGLGRGAIQTDGEWVDFLVRLFLSILTRDGKLLVSCDLGHSYPFWFDEQSPRDFAWREDLPMFEEMLGELGLLTGATAKQYKLRVAARNSDLNLTW